MTPSVPPVVLEGLYPAGFSRPSEHRHSAQSEGAELLEAERPVQEGEASKPCTPYVREWKRGHHQEG